MGEEKRNTKSPGRFSSSRLRNKIDDETTDCNGNGGRRMSFTSSEVG